MEKILALMLSAVLAATLCSCGMQDENKALISDAIEEVKETWESLYDDHDIDSEYLEIKNTRVIVLEEDASEIWDGFEDIVCIIEFELYSEYYGTDAYPLNVKYMDSVLVYENGDMEVSSMNLFSAYTSITFRTDYTDIIDSIEDYGSRYNQILNVNE